MKLEWKAGITISSIVVVSGVLWISAFYIYQQQNLSFLIIAYTLGLRHGFDADHILAIDNVTRLFLQQNKQPTSIGLFFSLGHSTVVVLATILVAVFAELVQCGFDSYSTVSKVFGPAVSSSFLILIAAFNAFAVYSIINAMKTIDNSKDTELKGGFLFKIFKKGFKAIDTPWKMYIVGFLFGLGFDTATEISLLSLAVLQSQSGQSVWMILFLPLLFTAGMTLVDTADALIMLGIYSWATISPLKKLYYNLLITISSFLFAILVALIQILGILREANQLEGGFWDLLARIDDNFDYIGAGILICFVASWIVSFCIYHVLTVRLKSKSEKPLVIVQT